MAAPAPASPDIETLVTMFPDVEKAVIVTVLEAQGDTGRAIDALLAIQGQAPEGKVAAQVESDAALAHALQEKMRLEEIQQEESRTTAAKSLELISSEDMKAVSEVFENMGKGWRDLTEKLSEVPLYSTGTPASTHEPNDEDMRLVRKPAASISAEPAHASGPAMPARSLDPGNPLLEPSDPDSPLTLSRGVSL